VNHPQLGEKKVSATVTSSAPGSSTSVAPIVMFPVSDAPEAVRTLNWQVLVLIASAPSEIDTAFTMLRQRRAGALFPLDEVRTLARKVRRAAQGAIQP